MIFKGSQILGLAITGGTDSYLSGIYVQNVLPDSPAARDGRLQPGDRILKVREIAAGILVLFRVKSFLTATLYSLVPRLPRQFLSLEVLKYFFVELEPGGWSPCHLESEVLVAQLYVRKKARE